VFFCLYKIINRNNAFDIQLQYLVGTLQRSPLKILSSFQKRLGKPNTVKENGNLYAKPVFDKIDFVFSFMTLDRLNNYQRLFIIYFIVFYTRYHFHNIVTIFELLPIIDI